MNMIFWFVAIYFGYQYSDYLSQISGFPVDYIYYACAMVGLYQLIILYGVIEAIYFDYMAYLRLLFPKDEYGSSKFMSLAEMKKLKLNKKGFHFLGMNEGIPLWTQEEGHILIVAPTRTGKGVNSLIVNLALDDRSCIVTDVKQGENTIQTAAYRKKEFGHEIVYLNIPEKYGFEAAHYNVCQIILDDLEHSPQYAKTDAGSIIRRLQDLPEVSNSDPYWPQGAELFGVVAILGLAVLGPDECNLVSCFELLMDSEAFLEMCKKLETSTALGGDLAVMARSVLIEVQTNIKTYGSFLTGAQQVVKDYTRSSLLGQISQKCSFRFSDTKHKKMTIYIGANINEPHEIKKGVGLWFWAAFREIINVGNNKPVIFHIDEAAVYKVEHLPEKLMSSTGLGIVTRIYLQSVKSMVKIYQNSGKDEIIDNCYARIFFGVTSLSEAEALTKELGDKTVHIRSQSDIKNDMSESQRSIKVPLLAERQILELDKGEQLVFIRSQKPMHIRKVGFHEIEPIRRKISPNTLISSKRYLGAVKMTISKFNAAGSITKSKEFTAPLSTHQPSVSMMQYYLMIRWWVLRFINVKNGGLQNAFLLFGLCWGVYNYGLPNVLYNFQHNGAYYTRCHYIGLTPPLEHNENCPLIVFRKAW